MRNPTMHRTVFRIFALLWAGLIFCFSAQDGEASAQISGGFMLPFAQLLDALLGEAGHTFVRKCAHFFLYAVLMALTTAGFRRQEGLRTFALPFALCVLYAVSDEIHQSFVPGRACRLYDVGIDALGCAAGAFCLWLVWKVIGRIRKKSEESREKE